MHDDRRFEPIEFEAERPMAGSNIFFELAGDFWRALWPLAIGGACGMLVALAQASGWL